MKKLLTIISIVWMSISMFAATMTVDKLLEKNWNVYKSNNPIVLNLENQLRLHTMQMKTAEAKYNDNYRQRVATAQSKGFNDMNRAQSKEHSIEGKELQEMAVTNRAIRAKIELLRLDYYKRNRKAFADWLEKHPQ